MSHHRHAGASFVGALLLMLAASFSLAAPALAQEALLPCELLDRIALPGSAGRFELACDLAGRGALNDRLSIVDRTTSRAVAWPELAGTNEAVWIFDYNGDATAELIINFRQASTTLIAELYDAQADPGRLAHQLVDGQVVFDNAIEPTVRVVAHDGWWVRDGRINFNLDIAVDGLVDAAFDVRNKLDGRIATDGQFDFTIRVRDLDGDARPDYDWRTLQPPPRLPPFALPRTFLMVNARGNEPPLAPVLPWPFIGGETYGYLTSANLATSDPPIQVNWENGTITTVGEFVRSRGNDGQWFVYSFEEVIADEFSSPNFEAPFAWYDLAADNDHAPELAVRLGYFPGYSPAFLNGAYDRPINFVRYSWDQTNDGLWDYKLGLLGNHEITSTVKIDDLEMGLVDYNALPGWVLDQSWGVASFVATEGAGALGEGIYTWDPSAWVTEQYFTGRSEVAMPEIDFDTYRGEDFRRIEPGLRGEYQLQLNNPVRLYVGAIDRKLHLMFGDRGLWNIDGQRAIHYANLDGDPFFDQWRYTIDDELVRQLNYAADYLVLAENATVTIKPAPAQQQLGEFAPPRDHQQWLDFGEQVSALAGDFKPDDFASMIGGFDGTTAQIVGATMRDFRPLDNGFRFVLALAPGFHAEGASLVQLDGLQAGSYVVSYNGVFSVEPLTAPAVSLGVQLPNTDLPLSEPAALHIVAANQGSEDASGLSLVASISRDNGAPVEIARRPLELLAGQPKDTLITWWPWESGHWQLQIHVVDAEERVLAERTQTLEVVESSWFNIPQIFIDSTGLRYRGPIFLFLPALALLLGLGVFLTRSAAAEEREP